MKSRFYYFIIIFSFCLTSCIKKEEDTPVYPNYSAYFRSTVIDSITGFPISNAQVGFGYPNNGWPSVSTTSNANGKYKMCESWGGDPRIGSYRPTDSTDIYVEAYTNNRFGYVKFKAAKLIVNDTITIPNTYLKPVGYIKAHIKDTSSVNIDGNQMSLNYHWLMTPNFCTVFYKPYGQIVDTIVYWKAFPNSNVAFDCLYNKSQISHDDVSNVHVNSGDTSSVNIFY